MKRVAVIGAGTMGAGIALAVAAGNFDVDLVEVDSAVRERAQARTQKDAERMKAPQAAARVRFVDSIGDLDPDTDLAIEAVPEALSLKHQIFTQLDARLKNAVLATNTSSLSVAEIADAAGDPSRVIGLHFFNPATVMKLVEIVVTPQTSDAVLDVARAFVESIGKTAVEAADTPGFIVNRVARPFYLQSLRALEKDLASPEDIDALARGAGFRMGPFELMDLIGIDVNLATTQSVFERLGADRFAPSPVQLDMVAQNKLGRKTGSGFYSYASGAGAPKAHEGPPSKPEANEQEVVGVIGFGDLADQIAELLSQTYTHVERAMTDDDIDNLSEDVTIVFDLGDGTSDRTRVLKQMDGLFDPDVMIFTDAYTTRLSKLEGHVKSPERFIGYGILGSFDSQAIVEIADVESTSDDALGLAEELFAALGKRVLLVGDSPGLYLGRTVASIVNEAVYAVQEKVATAEDIDTAMRLGTNYPIGPVAWGREIGGGRIARILIDLANEEGDRYAPARALWVLDAESEPAEDPEQQQVL